MYFDWIPPRPTANIGAQNGYSAFSFAILYLLARCIRLHGLPKWFKKSSLFIYVGCSLVVGLMEHVFCISGHVDMEAMPMYYDNPLVIISSVAFLSMFECINLDSKVVNHLAKSTLGVLLGHTAIFSLYQSNFKYIYTNFDGFKVIFLWSLSIIAVYAVCVFIDQIRLLLWTPLKRIVQERIKDDYFYTV